MRKSQIQKTQTLIKDAMLRRTILIIHLHRFLAKGLYVNDTLRMIKAVENTIANLFDRLNTELAQAVAM